jgi:2-alkyl-3-oxoalkanoate reductase
MPDAEQFPLPRVLVLGANGFIGRQVVAALACDTRMQPVAAIHRARSAVQGVDVETVICDATDKLAVARALSGVDAAVNCIAGSDATMIAATRVLCDVARRSGLQRLVHLSSLAIYGTASGRVTEAMAPTPPVSGYGRAKQICETLVSEYVQDGGHAVILRPGCVYGPGSEQWTGRIARLLRAGRLGDMGAEGDGICNLTYIDDLVGAILTTLTRDPNGGQTYNIAVSDPPTWNAYLTQYGIALGATPIQRLSGRRLKLETRLAAPALRLTGMGVKLARFPLQIPDAITPSFAALLQQNIQLDVRKATEELGLSHTPMDAGIAASVRWLRQGCIKGTALQVDPRFEVRQS